MMTVLYKERVKARKQASDRENFNKWVWRKAIVPSHKMFRELTEMQVAIYRGTGTFVLIEVKLSVAIVLSADEKLLNDFSQLILEAILVNEKDTNTVYNQLLLVLTDGTVCHANSQGLNPKATPQWLADERLQAQAEATIVV